MIFDNTVYNSSEKVSVMGVIRPPVNAISPRFLDQLSFHTRKNGLACKTEQTYTHWVKLFIFVYNKRHPKRMGNAEIAVFIGGLFIIDPA